MRSTAGLRTRGFTLVELLLVIVILGIVTLIVVQQFGSGEAEARTAVADYNASVVEKAIHDFKTVHGVYPGNYNIGFTDATATTSMAGLTVDVAANMAGDGTSGAAFAAGAVTNGYTDGCTVNTPNAAVVHTLAADQARGLREWGIHHFTYGVPTKDGFANVAPLSDTTPTCWVLTGGLDLYRGSTVNWDGSGTVGTQAVTINGRTLSSYQWGSECVVLVFVTENVSWSSVYKGDPDKTGYGDMTSKGKLGLAKAVRDANAPTNSAFPYYIAAFYVSPGNIGSKVGISCELIGILDANLNPVNP